MGMSAGACPPAGTGTRAAGILPPAGTGPPAAAVVPVAGPAAWAYPQKQNPASREAAGF